MLHITIKLGELNTLLYGETVQSNPAFFFLNTSIHMEINLPMIYINFVRKTKAQKKNLIIFFNLVSSGYHLICFILYPNELK